MSEMERKIQKDLAQRYQITLHENDPLMKYICELHMQREALAEIVNDKHQRLLDKEVPQPCNSVAEAVLKDALDALRKRGEQRDQPDGERSMSRAVDIFNSVTRRDAMHELEGWIFMVCLKLARSQQGGFNIDDYIDAAAYCALAAESIVEEHKLYTTEGDTTDGT